MRPFFTGPRLWPPGSTRPHLYVLPDLTVDRQLGRLVARAQAVLAEHPTVAPVAPTWLHATVQRLDGVPSADITTDQRQALAAALRTVPAFTVTAGPPLAGTSAVVLDVDGDQPGQPWAVLTAAVRTACAEVFGAAAVATTPGPPHLSIGYAVGSTESGDIQGRLRHQVRPARAPLTVTAVWLATVVQDPARAEYRWSVCHRIPLASAPA